MSEEQPQPRRKAFGRHVAAVLILLVCAWLLFHLLFHLVVFVATIAAVAVALIGIVWAVRVLL